MITTEATAPTPTAREISTAQAASAALLDRAARIPAALLRYHFGEAARLSDAALHAVRSAPGRPDLAGFILESAERIAADLLERDAAARDADYAAEARASLETLRRALPHPTPGGLAARWHLLEGLRAIGDAWPADSGPMCARTLDALGERGLEAGVDMLREVLRESREAANGLKGPRAHAIAEALGRCAAALRAVGEILDGDPFAGAEVIAAYTAADAERDGTLWRMPAEVAGPSMPVLLTRAAYADTVQWERADGANDETGRAHDVAMLLRMGPGTAALRSPGRPALLKVLRIPNRTPSGALSASHRATMTRLEVVAEGYSLAGEPCLIVRLEGERD